MTSDHIQQRIVLLLTDVHDAARAGDWPAVKAKSEQVLRLNPFNHDARAYWTLAKNGGTPFEETLEVRIARQLDAVKIAATVEDWHEVIAESEKVLDIDPGNAEAQRYLRSAQESLGRRPKKGLFGRNKPADAVQAPTPVSPPPGPPPRPTAAQVAAEPSVPKYLYVDNNFLSKAVAGAIALLSLLYLLAGVFYLYGAGILDRVARGEASAADASSFDTLATIVATVLAFGFAGCLVLFLIWLYREVTNARAMGMQTLFEPPVSIAVAIVLGTLGTYVVLRDLLAKLRDGFSPLGEGAMVLWALGAIGGITLNLNSIKQPADHGEWADLLRLTAYGSFLLTAAGLALVFSIRDGHEHLLDRYLRPRRAPRADAPTSSIAA